MFAPRLLPHNVEITPVTHCEFCFIVCVPVIDWLMWLAFAWVAVRSGDANNARATAIAENAMMDFVFIVTYLRTKVNINLVLTINPKIKQN